MDYARIYDQFIANRRVNPPLVDEYTETHHILPRSLGGSDEKDNLIVLRPEDHFFAHLLLAKIHGGMLWVPVVMWLGGDRRAWSGRRSRLAYGWASREASVAVRGTGAHQYDHTVHEFEHKDGRRFTGTQSEAHAGLGISRSGVNMLIKQRVGSFHGWFVVGNRPKHIGRVAPAHLGHPHAKKTQYNFHHFDGRAFTGTQQEFGHFQNIPRSSVCTLVRGTRSVTQGWYIEGRNIKANGRTRYQNSLSA